MNRERFLEILSTFKDIKIAVVGDYFLDKWLHIDPSLTEISVETGLDAYQVIDKKVYAGAAGTVCANLSAIGIGKIYAVGFIGDDGEGYDVIKSLHQSHIDTNMLTASDNVMTPTYTKPVFLDGMKKGETNRLDHKNINITPKELEDDIIANLRAIAPNVDAILALDQLASKNKGVITDAVRQELSDLSMEYKDLVTYVDSRNFIDEFRNMIVKCNDIEIVKIIKDKVLNEKDMDIVKECMAVLSGKTNKAVFTTCGALGVLAMGENGIELVKTIEQKGNIDIVGAGDACTSGIVSSLCAGASNKEAAFIGNIVSSITIQTIGTTGVASQEEMINRFDEYFG